MISMRVLALSLSLVAGDALAQAQDEVRLLFDHYIQAENEHNLSTVGQALQDSREMLWLTPRGTPVWGRDAVMQELTKLYLGAWKLEPEMAALKVTVYGDNVVRLVVPIRYTVGTAVTAERYLVQHTYIKTPLGWRISTIVPAPLPAQ
jgi:hypothetical protein